jgi:hypothetical protein
LSVRPLLATLVAACLSALAAASPVRAEPSAADKEAARAAWTLGMRSRADGRHEEALIQLRKAHDIMGLAATGFELANQEEALGRLIEARDLALTVAKMEARTSSDRDYQARALALYERLGPRIGTLQIRVSGPPAGALVSVRVDGEDVPPAAAALPRRVNPGKHTLTVGAPDFVSVDRTVDVAESATLIVDVPLSPEPAPPAEAAVTRPSPVLETPPAPRPAGPQPTWYTAADIAAAGKPPPGRAQTVAGGLLITAGSLGVASGAVVALVTEQAGGGFDGPAFGVIGASAALVLGGGMLVWNGRRLNRAALRRPARAPFQVTAITLSPPLSGPEGQTGTFVGMGGVF